MRAVFKKTGSVAIAVLLIVLTVAGWSFYEAWREHHDNPPPGQFFAVNGKELHIQCTGQGSPTIVLDSAASAPWSEWRLVQPQLSKITQVCSYDRPGHGWSPSSGDARDAEAVVADLHSLLGNEHIQKPFVLVGHSLAGLYVREYALKYPNELAGVALIESSSPHQIDELPGFRSSYEEDLRDSQGAELWKDRLRVWTGWDRLTGHCSVSPSRTVQGEWVAQYAAMACRPGYVDTDEMELPYFEASSKEAAQLRTFGSIPLLVVSRDIRFGTEDDTAAERARQPVWEHEQESEKLLSPKSWRVVANKSGHMVPLDRPDVIINEVTRLVSYLRGGDAPRFGSTTDSQ